MSIQESIQLREENGVAFVEFDLIGEKVNKLSSPVMMRFKEIVEELKTSNYKAVVLISKKPKIFIAGADIEEIKKLKTKEDFEVVVNQAHKIFNDFEDLPMPTIAVVHGACMGGGCELILTCDYRVCSDAPETKIGLPEVQLGILPGFGGCVRLPRVVGLQASLDIILAGKSVDSRKAKKIGLVDEVIPKELLEVRMGDFVQSVIGKGKRKKKFKAGGLVPSLLESALGRGMVFSQAKKMVLKNSKGFYPAPLEALNIVKKTYGMGNREKALAIELQGFTKVAVTDISKNLINLFFMMESIKKQTGVKGDVRPKKVSKIAVLGAGTMGGGIAQVAADKGFYVRMKDINNDSLSLGYKQAASIWAKKMKRKRLTKHDYDEKMSRITGGLDYAGFKNVDVAIEAIVEDMKVKKMVIAETAKHMPADSIIATNTSSLSVTEMAEAHPHPENFVGMHFFNPVDKMPLVEVIRGPKTSDEATATIFDLSKKMGKTPVVVKDGPGFLVNRLLMPYMIEAMFLLQDGMAIEKVDRWYTHKFGMPMGPFRLMDEVGLDVCVKVVKIFSESLGERIQVPEVAYTLAKSDRLGKKNSKGFYSYDSNGKETGVDQSIYKALGLKEPINPLTEKECLERGVFVMINEAALALIEDNIVETPQDVDLAMIMGTGFPPFRGGLLRYADSIGAKTIVEELEMYATKSGARLKPSAPLAQMASSNRTFY
ncbi:MAG: fatty oxidation complex subunit alpha [Bdellovibrionales bacterium]|nr:fatty oxidation complex subunit alpha [Bdellovibrionales bacterium]